jgi:hypothetical protein
MSIRIDVVGLGSLDRNMVNSLAICGGTVSIDATLNNVQSAFQRIAAPD